MSKVSVVIPTKNRPDKLETALQSVGNQTIKPKRVLVVSDSDDKRELQTLHVIRSKSETMEGLELLGNQRTLNVSGAINTALVHLLETGEDPESTYIALLDDDDKWRPEYLESCLALAEKKNLDWVISGIIRHETEDDKGRALSIPRSLSVRDFLVSNPHIQGSNLFVRFSTLLSAGGFDEFLESTTDRDLCIRLLDLGVIKYGFIRRHLVHHWAVQTRERLSTPGSKSKADGLRSFYWKHAPRMSTKDRDEFLARAKTIFNCEIDDLPPVRDQLEPRKKDRTTNTLAHGIPIVVGFTATRLGSTRNLLKDLIELAGTSGLISKLVIADNTSSTVRLRNLIREPGNLGLNVVLRERRQIDEECKSGAFGSYLLSQKRRKGIAAGRTIIHHYLYEEAKKTPGSVVWILDDDVRLRNLFFGERVSEITMEGLQDAIADMKIRGVSIAVGQVTGDPPVPPLSLIRTQLLDLLYNIKRFEQSRSDDISESLVKWNQMMISSFPEYYYDYSEVHAAHLEIPFWYTNPTEPRVSTGSLKKMLKDVSKISLGKNVFRPIVSRAGNEQLKADTVIARCGNTLVLNIECLRDFPNPSPGFGDINARRGDTFWCILNSRVGGRIVERFPISLRHERSPEDSDALSSRVLLSDFYGSSFVRSIDEFYQKRIAEQGKLPRRIPLTLIRDDIDWIVDRFEYYLNRRLMRFLVNSHRIRGLILSIRAALSDSPHASKSQARSVMILLSQLNEIFSTGSVQEIVRQGKESSRDELREFLTNLKEYVSTYRKKLANVKWQGHIEHARTVIKSLVVGRHLTHIGDGSEGALFTDGARIYKYFYVGLAAFQEGQLEFIRERVLRNKALEHMVYLEDIRIEKGELVFVINHEPGEKYQGGHWESFLELIKECRDSGIAITNFHPKNLIVSKGKVKFADIGNSIVPLNKREYYEMCKRAYLTYRWHFREDLGELMDIALRNADLPELFGFDEFLAALDRKTKRELLNQHVTDFLNQEKLCSVLDYGCGKGEIAEQLAKMGYDVTGFDTDTRMIEQNIARKTNVKYLDDEELGKLLMAGHRFQKIVCSLVLCTIEDDEEFNKVLSNMRKLLAPDGELILASCNPFYTFVQESESHIKTNIGTDKEYHRKIVYYKKMKESNRERKDVHRPFGCYKMAFHRSGFEIKDLREVRTTDARDLCPSSDFIVTILHSIEPAIRRPVSLLIKVCAMEWRTIDFQVKHIVKQLTGPQSFLEKVVIAERYEGPFLRQYSESNLPELEKKLDRLVEEGIIDHVIWAPRDADNVRRTLRRWFRLDSTNTHCANGEPIYSTLYGFDQCKGRYILQVDSDSLIARLDRNHDYLSDMIEIIEKDQKAITVSFNTVNRESKEYTRGDGERKWRTEVRFSVLDKDRLESILPLPNELTSDGILVHPWHRSLDSYISKTDWQSYRGGNSRTSFIHVPNCYKSNITLWYNIMKSVERGNIPDIQYGNVDLKGELGDWLGQRREPFIFIVRGRDTPVTKLRRCIDSILRQNVKNWGVVIIDAASTNGTTEYIEEVLSKELKDRVTILENHLPLTSMENNKIAITKLCQNPNSVIITLDGDDSLIGRDVLGVVSKAYDSGADLTVGSMLRTDKDTKYPVDLVAPRRNRGGNVWQHLRTFRKYLFDRIPEDYLRVDGEWVPVAIDWAFMLPMVEMANHPMHITQRLYYYEPTGRRDQEAIARRERIIGKIIGKAPCVRR